MNFKNLAAVGVSVYTRSDHLARCIASLRKSDLARHTHLYIFSDGPKKGDETAVERVRDFAASVEGFKKVHLNFQVTNDPLRNSSDCRQVPFLSHERAIFLEDDNVVSSHFLEFMNEALERYEPNKKILGISGYSPPVGQEKLVEADVFLSQFWSGWTAGTWRNRELENFIRVEKPYEDMVRNGLQELVRKRHPALPGHLHRMDLGLQRANDRKLTYFMIKNGLFQLRPKRSLVMNTGHDGSGVNCGVSHRFNDPPFEGKLEMPLEDISYRPEIDKRVYRFFYRSFPDRVISKLRSIRK